MIHLTSKTPDIIQREIAERMRKRRKEFRYSQAELAKRSGVSLGSLKRFEREHEISLASLVKLSLALDCQDELDGLFAKMHYRSIEEVIADAQ